MNLSRLLRSPTALLVVLLFLAALIVLWELAQCLLYELHGPYIGDSTLFWAVGRGMRNGLFPYRDLFETKTPAIFLLTAFSISMTDGMTLGFLAQTLVIGGIAALGTVFAFVSFHHFPLRFRIIGVAVFFIFCSLLALYTSRRAGGMLVESFGAFFGCLYVLVIVKGHPRYLSWLQMFLAGCCIFLAVAFKEPFMLSLASVALLLVPNPSSFFRLFLLPLLAASVLGFSLLVRLDYASGFFGIYLPEMLQRTGVFPLPLPVRAFRIDLLLYDLAAFSPALIWVMELLFLQPFLVRHEASYEFYRRGLARFWILLLIFFLSCSVLIKLLPVKFWYGSGILMSGLSIASVIIIIGFSGRTVVFRRRIQLLILAISTVVFALIAVFCQPHPFDILYWLKIVTLFFATIPPLLLLLLSPLPLSWGSVVRNIPSVLALYLLGAAIASGGTYFSHHFIFTVPVFFALFVRFFRNIDALNISCIRHSFCTGDNGSIPCAEIQKDRHQIILLPLLGALVLLAAFFHQPGQYSTILSQTEKDYRLARAAAIEVDAILDRCGVDSYLFLGGNGPYLYAFTQHSPLGPLFFQQENFIDNVPTHAFFRSAFLQNLFTARLIVFHQFDLSDLRSITTTYLDHHFTDEPWPCAGDVRTIAPYTLLYRNFEHP